ncbi:hypothetical protein [Trueperella abortisuis]|uniref:hypothetical protein n=1 Tax=Trueperella abortisuis TaxID=445930 RepID=UPI0028936F57|nr:hypothetical protein [Trueperella abortisuis]
MRYPTPGNYSSFQLVYASGRTTPELHDAGAAPRPGRAGKRRIVRRRTGVAAEPAACG